MHNTQKRRDFLRLSALAAACFPMAGCGGGSKAEDTASTANVPVPAPAPTPAPALSPASAPSPSPAPAPAPTGSMQFTLQSATTQTAAPFCLGFAFKKGDIPAGSSAIATVPGIQVSPKNVWPDGSLKFAIVAGRAAITANQPRSIGFTAGTAAAGTALTLADLKATGVAASVGCGAFGTASWTGSDWDAPFKVWVSGAAMSSWIYRKPVGTDAHLVAWLEVRLYAGGEVEVLPWIENGYIRVASPTSKGAFYSFTLGSTQRFGMNIDLPSHCRTPLLSGQSLSYWLGPDVGISVHHDTAYMQSTRLVPTYAASVPSDAAVVVALPKTYSPLQLGSYTDRMGSAGYQGAIGILPEWDVLYLTANSGAELGGVVRNAYSAGRWAIHYRDEATNRPLRFSANPNLSTNSSSTYDYPVGATGTSGGSWDIPHHPSVGYMAYLLTGLWYHMETVQFAATYNGTFQVDALRGYAACIFLSYSGAATGRGAAWGIRTLAQAATVTPDEDAVLRAEFVASLESNVNWNHARYVAIPNNPFGVIQPYGDYGSPTDGMVRAATWQEDFYCAAFGYALALDPPISAAVRTRLSAFFAWKSKFTIGRFGGAGASEWLYRDACPYIFVCAQVDNPDWATGTGPWPTSFGAMYDATYAGSAAPGPRVEGDLRGGNFPEPTSYWGNLQPALSYAVEHGVPGAAQAYSRMTSAANWSRFTSGLNQSPVWGVRPAIS